MKKQSLDEDLTEQLKCGAIKYLPPPLVVDMGNVAMTGGCQVVATTGGGNGKKCWSIFKKWKV